MKTGLQRFFGPLLAVIGLALILYSVTTIRDTSEPPIVDVKDYDLNYIVNVGALELPTTYDPNDTLQSTLQRIMVLLYDGLFVVKGAAAQLSPHLVSKWSYDAEKKLYSFELRSDVKFWDGTPLLAEDVKSNFETWVGEKGFDSNMLYAIKGAPEFHRGEIDSLDAVQVIGSHKLQIQLSRHDYTFLRSLSNHRFLVVKKLGGEIIGTGPFIPAEKEKDKVYFRKNSAYFQGAAKVMGIRFEKMTPSELRSAIEKGAIDLTWQPMIKEGLVTSDYHAVQELATSVEILYLNTTFPHFNTLQKRRAVFQAIDLMAIEKKCNRGERAKGLIPPGTLGHSRKIDPLTASPSPSSIRWPEFVQTIYLEESASDVRCVATEMNHGFMKEEIPIRTKLAPFSKMETLWRAGKLAAGIERLGFRPGREIKLFYFFSQGNRECLVGKTSKEFEALIQRGREAMSMADQVEVLRELDAKTIENGYAFPLFYPDEYYYVRKQLYSGEMLFGWTPDWSKFGMLK